MNDKTEYYEQLLQDKIKLKNYSENTHRNYLCALRMFRAHFKGLRPHEISDEKIEQYLLQIPGRTNRCTHHNGIKFFYQVCLNQNFKMKHIPYPEKEDKLPCHVTAIDFVKIMSVCKNLKHKCVLMLAYDGGLRVSEIVNLKITDINSQLMQINIVQSKGRKDRKVKLSNIMLQTLRDYYKNSKPRGQWLFEGQKEGKQYSVRSCQLVMDKCVKDAGVNPNYTMHKNRHGYAMALLENGTELDNIREYLGHSALNTTRIYARMDNRIIQKNKSPLEILTSK